MTAILLLGSGPGVVRCADWPRAPFDRVVAINNAWRVRDDWDDLVYPWDFPADRLPPEPQVGAPKGRLVNEDDFVPAQNLYGGFVYAGATMAFTTAYWVLAEYRPRVIGFLGCDMHYPDTGPTHFYGTGTPDPLRADITLQSLEAKSARLRIFAADQGCALVNLSDGPTRLALPRATPQALPDAPAPYDRTRAAEARAREAALDYTVPSGRYWDEIARFDPAELRALDAIWLEAGGNPA
jgi:hypothetical protein